MAPEVPRRLRPAAQAKAGRPPVSGCAASQAPAPTGALCGQPSPMKSASSGGASPWLVALSVSTPPGAAPGGSDSEMRSWRAGAHSPPPSAQVRASTTAGPPAPSAMPGVLASSAPSSGQAAGAGEEPAAAGA